MNMSMDHTDHMGMDHMDAMDHMGMSEHHHGDHFRGMDALGDDSGGFAGHTTSGLAFLLLGTWFSYNTSLLWWRAKAAVPTNKGGLGRLRRWSRFSAPLVMRWGRLSL